MGLARSLALNMVWTTWLQIARENFSIIPWKKLNLPPPPPPPLPTQTQTAHQISYDAVDNQLPKISQRISTTRLQMKKSTVEHKPDAQTSKSLTGKTTQTTQSRQRFVCLVCFETVLGPTREFFTDMERSTLPMKDCKFWPIIGNHWGFFSVPHLMWDGTSIYNGYLRGPVTLAHVTERVAVDLTLPILTT